MIRFFLPQQFLGAFSVFALEISSLAIWCERKGAKELLGGASHLSKWSITMLSKSPK